MDRTKSREQTDARKAEIAGIKKRVGELQDALLADLEVHLVESMMFVDNMRKIADTIKELRGLRGSIL
jgi:hypothetical protein